MLPSHLNKDLLLMLSLPSDCAGDPWPPGACSHAVLNVYMINAFGEQLATTSTKVCLSSR